MFGLALASRLREPIETTPLREAVRGEQIPLEWALQGKCRSPRPRLEAFGVRCANQGLPAHARASSSQQLKRGAQQLLGAGISERLSSLQLGKRHTDLGLTKTEPAQGGEDLGVCVERVGSIELAVGAAIGVLEGRVRRGTLDGELAAMDRTVVNAADGEDIFGRVPATFGAELDVMQVEVQGVLAAGDAAAAVITQQHGTT